MTETQTAYAIPKVLWESDALLVRAYKSSSRRTWIVYREAARIFGSYARGKDSTATLAQRLGVSNESIANWARAGWLRSACRGMEYTDETGRVWTFYDLRQALGLAHFVVGGRALHRELVSPEDVFEWLCLAAVEGKSADWLAAQVMPADGGVFVRRLGRLLTTPLPDDWPEDKREAGARWLAAGKELLR